MCVVNAHGIHILSVICRTAWYLVRAQLAVGVTVNIEIYLAAFATFDEFVSVVKLFFQLFNSLAFIAGFVFGQIINAHVEFIITPAGFVIGTTKGGWFV